MANYRRRYSAAGTNAARKQISQNFSRNYAAWLKHVKAQNLKRRRTEQELYNSIRAAKAAGNMAALNKILSGTRSASPRRPRSAPTPRRKSSQSLFKKMHHNRLTKMHKNLRAEIVALESQRNAIEAQINNIRRRIRELPSPPRHP